VAISDALGDVELTLASNLDGTQNSLYEITISAQGAVRTSVVIQMPQANTSLEQLVDVLPITTSYTTAAAISAAIAQDAAEDPNVVAVAGALGTITTVATNIANVNTVAGVSANVTTVAGISANVTTVAGAAANISTVATNVANVNTVAGISDNVTSVATNSANINTVAAANTNITTVAANIANVNTVAGANAAVTTVATNIANVNTVVTNVASVNTVAGNVANVNTVAGISANVTSVASNSTNIDTVATNMASVNTVATNVAATTTVATNIADVNTVATNIADVGLVADDIADVNLVADDIESVTTVAGKMSDVIAVAAVAGDLSTVATANANITIVATNIANVNTVAGISANVTTVAGISAAVVAAPTHAATATTQAEIATTQAGIAATQAGLAATARVGSETARDQAIAIVYGGTYSINAAAGNVPIADTDARLGNDWLDIGTNPNEIPLNQFLGGMAYQDPDNVTIGGGSATLTSMTATTVTGTSMVYNGTELNSRLNPLAQAVSVQMTGATSGSNGIQQLDNVNLNPGVNDFTLHWEGALPDWSPSTGQWLIGKQQDASNRFGLLLVDPSGTLRILAVVAGVTIISATTTLPVGAADGASLVIDACVTRETSTAAGSVTVYINGTQLGASIAIPSAATVGITNTGTLQSNGIFTARTAGTFRASRLFNRALTAAEVLSQFINGVALADRGANQTNPVSGSVQNGTGSRQWPTFSSTANSFTAASAYTATQLLAGWPINVVAGQRIRVSFSYSISVAVGTITGQVAISTSSSNNTTVSNTVTFAAGSGTVTADLIPTLTGTYFVSVSGIVSGASGDINLSTTNLSVRRAGLTSELLAINAQSNTGQIFDTSGNKNHALLPASGATIVGQPEAIPHEVRWTNTWAGTNELQYIGGVNQAILPANAFIESITVKVTGTDVHDVIVGDGSDPDRYVVISGGGSGHGSVALTVGSYDLPLANQATDGTNLKLTVDPDTNCTMSIAWVIRYSTLEA
jgi:hypothetical protein